MPVIPTMPFGRTGHHSTRVIFGAAALGSVTQAEADATLDVLLQYGINHIDTAASYGESELRIGPWMRQHRSRFFLASKTEDRTRQAAYDSIQRSLNRLQTDSLDLIQLHNLSDPQEWQTALGPGGALEALIDARQQGLVRWIGVTGHGVQIARMHSQALDRFDFDAVLLPYNFAMWQNPAYVTDFNDLQQVCIEKNVALQTIKGLTRAPWGEHQPQNRATWYAPFEEQKHIDLTAHWVLGNPNVFLNSVGDIQILPRLLDAAARFTQRPSEQEMQALAQETGMAPLFT
jgi:aryl-alcohol dehydrogenase-like predicted oxidoreductase